MFLVEEHRRAEIQLLKCVARCELAVALDGNAEILDETLGGVAVGVRRRDALGAAVPDERAPVVLELVALRMAAEIVVVVEHQHALLGTERLPPEVRGRQPRDAAADDHQVVSLLSVDVERGTVAIRAALYRCEGVDGRRIVASETGGGWRIERLRARRLRLGAPSKRVERHRSSGDARANRQSDPIQEIAARNPPSHPQVAVLVGHRFLDR